MTWERALSTVSLGRLVRLRASSTEATIFGVGIFFGATAKLRPFARTDCWGWVRDFEERFTTQFLGASLLLLLRLRSRRLLNLRIWVALDFWYT